MITAIVQIRLPAKVALADARKIFETTAPQYQVVAGLIRKYYLLSEDEGHVGGVYLWESREQALAQYSEDWVEFVRQKYGTRPSVQLFETPVVVDNILGQIIVSEDGID
ncbi:YdhR family protein [Pseudomonas sp. YH-1]|uniref:YdhR family protein n=1 Tax=Pseudomonas sp. YH-1 TaxID=3384787 RepID=UPI003F7F8C64